MEKEPPSHKWTSNETNLFCNILPDPVKNFYVNYRERGAKKYSAVKYLIPLLLNLQKVWKMLNSKKNNQNNLKQNRKNPNWWRKSKSFHEKPCNMESKV